MITIIFRAFPTNIHTNGLGQSQHRTVMLILTVAPQSAAAAPTTTHRMKTPSDQVKEKIAVLLND